MAYGARPCDLRHPVAPLHRRAKATRTRRPRMVVIWGGTLPWLVKEQQR